MGSHSNQFLPSSVNSTGSASPGTDDGLERPDSGGVGRLDSGGVGRLDSGGVGRPDPGGVGRPDSDGVGSPVSDGVELSDSGSKSSSSPKSIIESLSIDSSW